MCFRCYELGHKAVNCRHSFKELAELERTGILEINKRRNFIPGNHNNYNYKFMIEIKAIIIIIVEIII